MTLATINDIRKHRAMYNILIETMDHPDKSIEDICKEHKVKTDTFRRWVRKSPDMLDALREYIDESQRSSLVELEIAWTRGVSELAKLAASPNLKPKDRVTVMKLLHTLRAEYETQYHAAPGIEEEAHAFLKQGMELQKIPSRMASITVEPTENSVTLHITGYQDLIDTQFTQEDPSE